MSIIVSAVTVAITTLEAAAIATAVMEVGIAMTVVGTITKSSELTKIGGVLSMAGGVASLAIGVTGMVGAAAGGAGVAEGATAGAFSDVAGEKFAQAAAGEIGGTVAASGMEAAGAGAGMQSFGIADPSAGIADTLGGNISDSAMSPISSGFDAKVPALGNLGDAPALNAQAAAPQVSGVASAAPMIPGQPGVAQGMSPGAYSDVAGEQFAQSAVPKPGMFQDMKTWYKGLTPDAQSRIGAALVQGGGQAVGGLFQGWSAEQKLALEQQGQDLAKQKYDVATANASYVPTIAFKPVSRGLIAGAQGVK